jgi:hypothetical protein
VFYKVNCIFLLSFFCVARGLAYNPRQLAGSTNATSISGSTFVTAPSLLPVMVVTPVKAGSTGQQTVYRRKLNRAWETLRSMPMPAIASDRLVDLHNDLTHYDTVVSKEVREFLRGNAVNPNRLVVDHELEESLRTFKAENQAEVECRRDMLRYKRRVDDVVRELTRLNDERPVHRASHEQST